MPADRGFVAADKPRPPAVVRPDDAGPSRPFHADRVPTTEGAEVGATAGPPAPPGVVIEPAAGVADCAALIDAFNRIWEAGPDHSVIDLVTVVAMATSGSPVTVARVGGEVVGGTVGFFGPPGGPLHSHIAGVLADLAPAGTGLALKLDQRERCLALGLTRMTWTFDPLIARNARFNLVKLGARAAAYLPDHYGVMRDTVNRGQASDRVLVEWDLTAGPTAPAGDRQDGHVALADVGGRPGPWSPPPAGHRGPVLVAVPYDVVRLRREDPGLAAQWRTATREAFLALGERWRVTTFRRSGHYELLPTAEPPA